MSKVKRCAVCGVSARAIGMFIKPVVRDFSGTAEAAGLPDIDPLRFKVCRERVPETKDLPEYGSDGPPLEIRSSRDIRIECPDRMIFPSEFPGKTLDFR